MPVEAQGQPIHRTPPSERSTSRNGEMVLIGQKVALRGNPKLERIPIKSMQLEGSRMGSWRAGNEYYTSRISAKALCIKSVQTCNSLMMWPH